MINIESNNEILSNSEDYEVRVVKSSTKKEEVRDYVKTPEVVKLLELYGSKSNAIHKLHEQGMSRSEIADTLRICYQHVRNVLTQEKKKK